MRFASLLGTFALVALTGLWPAALSAHGEQIKVGATAKGPIRLTPAQEHALGLTLAAAAPRPVADVLYLNGEVRPVAGRQAQASSRIPGQITQVYVTVGQYVRVGQRLARVQARLVGDPPPSVDILAPMSGTIEQVTATVGQSIEPSTPLFSLRDSREVSVVARVYEEDLGKVRVGQDTTLDFISYPGQPFAGRIQLLGPSLDPLTRTVEVWVTVSNDQGILRPNLFARVGVILRQEAAALTVPTAAVIEANGERFVFLKQSGGYVRTEIQTGVRDHEVTEVTGGLVPGDKVVVQGNRQVYTLWLTGGVPTHDEDD